MNREAFEASYASSHDLPLETFSQYRMGDTYRLPGIASHWRTWQMALESAPDMRILGYLSEIGALRASQGSAAYFKKGINGSAFIPVYVRIAD